MSKCFSFFSVKASLSEAVQAKHRYNSKQASGTGEVQHACSNRFIQYIPDDHDALILLSVKCIKVKPIKYFIN